MSAVDRSIARLVYDRAGGACEYCGRALRRREATMDHWWPRHREGGEEIANLRCACAPCNTAKGHMAPDDWMPIALERRRLVQAREGARRLSRIELLQRCAPLWRADRSEGGAT